MALKSKKKHPNSPKKEVVSARTWPDLPRELVDLISSQPTVVQSTSTLGGVAKSWKVISRRCNPMSKSRWPQLECREWHGKPGTQASGFRHGYPWNYFRFLSNGLLMATEPVSSSSLMDPVSRSEVILAESSVSSKNRIVMVFAGIHSPSFMFYTILSTGPEQILAPLDIGRVDPYRSARPGVMEFTNVINYEKRIYALSVQGSLVVIEETGDDSKPKITGYSRNRAVPTVFSKHFKEYLIESGGLILLVLMISRKTLDIVDDVEIFRLNLSRLSWSKIESVGDSRTLFLGANCCFSVDANKVGCKPNCVYFSHFTDESWWLYDIKTGCISECTTPVVPYNHAKRSPRKVFRCPC